MHHIEVLLIGRLSAEIDAQLSQTYAPEPPSLTPHDDPAGWQFNRHLLPVVRQQARQLTDLTHRLASLENMLEERKQIDKAKGLLIQHQQLTEDQAWKAMRKMAMDQNRRIVDIAAAILRTMAASSGPGYRGYLPGPSAGITSGTDTVYDLLTRLPVRPDGATLVGLLGGLQPRLYSIASSPLAHPKRIHLTVSTVRDPHHNGVRQGVCSTWLADRALNQTAEVFIQSSGHFHLPEDPTVPIIMVGPGTGIAPFRGFLQHRQHSGATGPNWLFFGEQHQHCDFYYREELEGWLASGLLHRLDTAFSRDQPEKIYIQQRMAQQGEALWQWLQRGAWLNICGDATHMAKDVEKTLLAIIATHGAMTPRAAQEYLATLKQEKRYRRDVY